MRVVIFSSASFISLSPLAFRDRFVRFAYTRSYICLLSWNVYGDCSERTKLLSRAMQPRFDFARSPLLLFVFKLKKIFCLYSPAALIAVRGFYSSWNSLACTSARRQTSCQRTLHARLTLTTA
jgi:hypothetical protein